MKKLLIDVNSIVPYYVTGRVTGIGRTTLELIQALDKATDLPFEVMLYSQNMKGIGGRNVGLSFSNKHLYLPNREKVNKLLARLPVKEWLSGYDLMHIPHNFEYVARPEKCVVTLHDAMFFSYPETFLGHDFARTYYPTLAKKARAILTCSENSKKEIAHYMNVPLEKIFVTHWGVDHQMLYPRSWAPNNYSGSKPFFFSVSCDIGRKNTIAVLQAYEQMLNQCPDHHLILVWKNPPADIRANYTAERFKNRIHFISNIPNKELAQLYSSATAVFFPSKYEGFGLPVLEAMAAGTPVVTCRNSSLGEVGGDAALYVEPEDIDAMAQWMCRFENKEVDRDELQKKCIAQASKFTWEACARKTIEVYKKCLEL